MLNLLCRNQAAAIMWYHLLQILLLAESKQRDPARIPEVSMARGISTVQTNTVL